MNSSFFLQQIQETSNLDANLISRHYKLNLMADFIRIKYENPKMKQSQTANHLSKPSKTLQRYRNDLNMLLPYTISANNTKKRSKKALNTTFDNNSQHEANVKKPQVTSNDLKRAQSASNKTKTKNNLKGGSIQENIEINEHYLDKILKNNDR